MATLLHKLVVIPVSPEGAGGYQQGVPNTTSLQCDV